MADKELRRLNRRELLEILIEQMEENKRLHSQMEILQEELSNRRIMIEKAGSIAEAALALNQVFESADKAARQYLESVQCIFGELPYGKE